MAKEHTVNKIEAKLYIPDDWYVFSKDSSIGDYPFLDEGIFDTGMKTVASEDVCLCAVSPEFDSTIIIRTTPGLIIIPFPIRKLTNF